MAKNFKKAINATDTTKKEIPKKEDKKVLKKETSKKTGKPKPIAKGIVKLEDDFLISENGAEKISGIEKSETSVGLVKKLTTNSKIENSAKNNNEYPSNEYPSLESMKITMEAYVNSSSPMPYFKIADKIKELNPNVTVVAVPYSPRQYSFIVTLEKDSVKFPEIGNYSVKY